MEAAHRWTGIDVLISILSTRWDVVRYIRIAPLSQSRDAQQSDGETFRLEIEQDSIIEEMRPYLADGVDLDNPTKPQVIMACVEWIKERAKNFLLEYPSPLAVKIFIGGVHEKTQTKRDLTSTRIRVEEVTSHTLPTEMQAANRLLSPAPPPPPTEAADFSTLKDAFLKEELENCKALLGFFKEYANDLTKSASTFNHEILNRAQQLLGLNFGVMQELRGQNEVLQAKVMDSSTRLFQRADEQQQRSAEERRELFDLQAEERKAATRLEIGKQIVHQLGGLGQTYLGGKAVPPELLELLPILPPEVFQALTDKDVIDALKNSAELRELLKEMVVNVRDSVKAGKAKAEAEAAQKAAGEKNQGGNTPNDNEEAA